MKFMYNKLFVAAILFAILGFGLILTTSILNTSNTSSAVTGIFPKFVEPQTYQKHNEEFVIEKIEHKQKDGKDVRSTLYLTHHGYLLSKLANIEVTFSDQSYSLKDICYKPHNGIFENTLTKENLKKFPPHIQRLLLEIQRLSPCLIVTPLNCFYDSYRIHSEISQWNIRTDFLNGKLRNAYIDAIGNNEERPYVKSTHSPELIKVWSNHLLQLPPQHMSSFSKKELSKKIDHWLSGIEPKMTACVDPNRSCNKTAEEKNYFEICTVMQQVNDYDDRKIQFEFEKDDNEFITRLDCVEDHEKFIEWMQERELRKFMKTFTSANRQDVSNQHCDGIYYDLKSSESELFDAARNFDNITAPFDSIRAEIFLMTPNQISTAIRQADYVNGIESSWSIEKSRELLEEFRLAIREEVKKFNDSRSSEQIGVISRVVNEATEENEKELQHHLESAITFILFSRIILLVFFSIFVWSVNPVRSVIMFLIRDALTLALFSMLCKADGLILLDSTLMSYFVLLTVVNIFLTVRLSNYRHRLETCIQKTKGFTIKSNFSSLGSVESYKEGCNPRQVKYIVSKLTKYQAAQDAYSDERFEKISKYWMFISITIIAVASFYWYFVDSNLQKICIILIPSFLLSVIEEIQLKNTLRRERKEAQKSEKGEVEKFFSRKSVDRLFSGNPSAVEAKKPYEIEEALIQRKSDGKLYELSQSTYDVSKIMAYPNQVCRDFRFGALGCYLYLMKLRWSGILLCAVAQLFILVSIGLLFIPAQRYFIRNELNQDDLFFDFSIENASSSWEIINDNLKKFNSDIDSIRILRPISNWKKSFDRFEGQYYQNTSLSSDMDRYLNWMNEEPMIWSITSSLAKPSNKRNLPNPFQFRFRYDFDAGNNVSAGIETTKKIDALLNEYSGILSNPTADSVLFDYYHQNAVVWDSFAVQELLATIILFAFFTLIVTLFSVKQSVAATIFFSFFVVGTRLEISAIVSIFSLEYQQLYTNSAVLFGFLAAWTPFCDLSRYRARVLYKIRTRTEPELATKRRVRFPYCAAVDTAHFFSVLIAVFVVIAIVAAVVPQLRSFFLPTVILIVIQIFSLGNSVAASVATNQMFEQDVRRFTGLGSRSTTEQVIEMTRKLMSTSDNFSVPISQFSIQPTESNATFYAPPPPKKKHQSEEDPEIDEDGRPGTSRYDQDPSAARASFTEYARQNGVPEETTNRFCNTNAQFNSGKVPWHWTLGGPPIDNNSLFSNQPEVAYNAMRRDEELYELDEDGPSSEEDVDSEGASDEEVRRIEHQLLGRIHLDIPEDKIEKAKNTSSIERIEVSDHRRSNDLDHSNVPGPSTQTEQNNEAVLNNEIPIPTIVSGIIERDPLPPRYRLIERPRRLHEIPPIIGRDHPRNPLIEPPSMIECLQEYSDPSLPPHPRTNQYPGYSQAMVAYCEDVYWTYNEHRLPPGLTMPTRPADWNSRPREVPPPENFNYVPPPGRPSIPIPAEALVLFGERRDGHNRRQQEMRNNDNHPPNLNHDSDSDSDPSF